MIIEECLTLRPSPRRIQRTDTFTLRFPGGAVAVLNVYNAPTFLVAMTIALEALPGCSHTVTNGDRTDGQAAIFHAWGYQPGQDAHDPSTGEEGPHV